MCTSVVLDQMFINQLVFKIYSLDLLFRDQILNANAKLAAASLFLYCLLEGFDMITTLVDVLRIWCVVSRIIMISDGIVLSNRRCHARYLAGGPIKKVSVEIIGLEQIDHELFLSQAFSRSQLVSQKV